MRTEVVEKGLRELREGNPAVHWAIMSRDGVVMHAELPDGVHHETFAIMCATMLGAALTLNSEFPEGDVERIIVEAGRYRVIVIGLDLERLMAIIVPRNMDLSSLLVYIQKVRKQSEGA
jgi:predicted regulator of Ras-like GTPase activity (Roadblock/LC7/MglB family)